jgi:hypothetical protein
MSFGIYLVGFLLVIAGVGLGPERGWSEAAVYRDRLPHPGRAWNRKWSDSNQGQRPTVYLSDRSEDLTPLLPILDLR